jgi:hypothetical protein
MRCPVALSTAASFQCLQIKALGVFSETGRRFEGILFYIFLSIFSDSNITP